MYHQFSFYLMTRSHLELFLVLEIIYVFKNSINIDVKIIKLNIDKDNASILSLVNIL